LSPVSSSQPGHGARRGASTATGFSAAIGGLRFGYSHYDIAHTTRPGPAVLDLEVDHRHAPRDQADAPAQLADTALPQLRPRLCPRPFNPAEHGPVACGGPLASAACQARPIQTCPFHCGGRTGERGMDKTRPVAGRHRRLPISSADVVERAFARAWRIHLAPPGLNECDTNLGSCLPRRTCLKKRPRVGLRPAPPRRSSW